MQTHPNVIGDCVIVVKRRTVKTPIDGVTYVESIDSVCATEQDADRYIALRKALKDRDDRGCTFHKKPWAIITVE